MTKVTRILFIADIHPCPPTNGLYVPLYALIKHLKLFQDIRLELALPDNDFNVLNGNSDQYFEQIYYLPLVIRSRIKKFLDIIFFRRPSYTKELKISSLKVAYDVVIATPDGYIDTLRALDKAALVKFKILWLNELYFTVYLGKLLNLLPYQLKKFPYMLYLSLKLGMIYLHEKYYLAYVDAIVVQTKREQERFNAFKSPSCKTHAFIFSNPIQSELLTHAIEDHSNVILIHAPRNLAEISSFVHDIAFYIQQQGNNIVVRICSHDWLFYKHSLGSLPQVQFFDYQENIANVYQGVFCALVFTRQRYGLVNRVKEGMTAGVSVIAYSEALLTVGEVLDQVHAVYVMNQQDFVNRAIDMITNRELAVRIGVNARKFIIENELYSHEKFTKQLLSVIKQPIEIVPI